MKNLSLSAYCLSLVGSLICSSAWAGVNANNDDFADATLISGENGTTQGTNFGATSETNDPLFLTDLATVWWRWQAPTTGRYHFDTSGSGLEDTLMGVYQGTSLENLVAVGENDDASPSNLLSLVTFNAVAGQIYFIAVAGYEQTEGPITLNWNLILNPVTDSPNLPVMVYGLRTVVTTEGADEFALSFDDLPYGWARRRTTVSTSLLVRGRDQGAHLDSDGLEAGPVALVSFYNAKAPRVSDRSFAIEIFYPEYPEADEEAEVPPGETALQSQVVRYNRSPTSVAETLRAKVVVSGENEDSTGLAVLGKATLKAPYKNAPKTWFASKLVGKREAAFGDAVGFEHEPQAGMPVPGRYYKETQRLTFNARETAKAAGMSFEEAVEAIRESYEERGWFDESP